MVAKISQEEYENRINKLLKYDKYEYIGVKGEFKGNKTRISIKCEKHGEWTSSISSFTQGNRCPGCAGNSPKSAKEHKKQIKEICEGTTYSFVGWDGEYKNAHGKFRCKCEKHGEWTVSIVHFIRGSRCPGCAIRKVPICKEEKEKQLKEKCKKDGYSFVGWTRGYIGCHSLITLYCPKCGEWSTKASVYLRSGCPSCAPIGYRPAKTGTLYCLRSECGQFVKIGISNNHKQRFAQLRRSTPFDFHVIELFTHEDGSKAREWEKLFHQSFASANLTGFDGCTEWLKWDPKIPEWFRFIN